MYIPAHFAADDATVRELLARHGAADLITLTADGLLATMLPFAYEPAAGEQGALYGHVARTNDQWRKPALGESLAIVRGPDAYVSPSWYAAQAAPCRGARHAGRPGGIAGRAYPALEDGACAQPLGHGPRRRPPRRAR